MTMDYAILAAWWILNLPYCYTSSYISVYLTWAFISQFVTFSPYLKWNFIMNYTNSKLIYKLVTDRKKKYMLCSCISRASRAASYYLWDKTTCYSALKFAWWWRLWSFGLCCYVVWWMGFIVCCYMSTESTCVTFKKTVSAMNSFCCLNLLKPTGYVMHQQFNIQQLYALPTLYLCVLYLSQNKQRLVPLTA